MNHDIISHTYEILENYVCNKLTSDDLVYMEANGLIDSDTVQAFIEGKLAFDWNSSEDLKLSAGNDLTKQLLNNYVEKASKLVYSVKADPANTADMKKATELNKEISQIESSTKPQK